MSLARFVVVLFVLCCSVIGSDAQNRPSSFDAPSLHVSYGLFGAQWLVEGLSDVISSGITGGILEPGTTEWPTGPVNVAVIVPMGSWLRFGGEYSYTRFDKQWKIRSTSEAPDEQRTYSNTYHALMARLDLLWVHADNLHLYSSGAVGGGLLVQSSGGSSTSAFTPAFHVTALGVRIGGGLSFFAEAGFGYRGLLIGGVALTL